MVPTRECFGFEIFCKLAHFFKVTSGIATEGQLFNLLKFMRFVLPPSVCKRIYPTFPSFDFRYLSLKTAMKIAHSRQGLCLSKWTSKTTSRSVITNYNVLNLCKMLGPASLMNVDRNINLVWDKVNEQMTLSFRMNRALARERVQGKQTVTVPTSLLTVSRGRW